MTSTKPSAPRVRQHRQQLQRDGNVRFEVTIGADVAASIKALAASPQVPVWVIVQNALSAYVTDSKP